MFLDHITGLQMPEMEDFLKIDFSKCFILDFLCGLFFSP